MNPFELIKERIISLQKKERDERALILMCGVPNSGKSTLVEDMVAQNPEIEVISRDNILMEYGEEKFGGFSYSEIWSKLTRKNHARINEELTRRIVSVQLLDKHAIIDMTMLTPEVRAKMINDFGNEYVVGCFNVVASFPTILKRNKERNEKTGKNIPENVLRDMFLRYKIATVEENERIKVCNCIITD